MRLLTAIAWWIFLLIVGAWAGYSIPHEPKVNVTELVDHCTALTDIVAEQLLWEKKIAGELK